MTSRTSRPTTTILVLVPLVAVPLLAVFGIPQFAPVAASQSYDGDEFEFGAEFPLDSDFAVAADESKKRSADDLFAPFPDGRNAFGEPSMQHDRNAATNEPPRERWEDLFREPGESSDVEVGHSADPRFSRDGLSSPNSRPDKQIQQVADASAMLRPTQNRPAVRHEPQDIANPRISTDRSPHKATFTWQDAVGRLKELSINHYRLEPGLTDNEFVFRCRFTPEDNPRVTYLLEAEAADPLRAVQKVLAEIDELLESRRRAAVLIR
jgi:hypothetical protein